MKTIIKDTSKASGNEEKRTNNEKKSYIEIPSPHWCSDRERHLERLRQIPPEDDNLKIFIEETHLNMMLRMMHFYDLLTDKNNYNAFDDITNVLKFIGWNYHGVNEQFEKFFAELNVDFSQRLSREHIRYIFRLWIRKVSSEPVLLYRCFTYFDYDSDGYISKDEILKILYRTIEERRIKLKSDIIPKLNVGVYYKHDLGLSLGTKRQVPTKKTPATSSYSIQRKRNWSSRLASLINAPQAMMIILNACIATVFVFFLSDCFFEEDLDALKAEIESYRQNVQ